MPIPLVPVAKDVPETPPDNPVLLVGALVVAAQIVPGLGARGGPVVDVEHLAMQRRLGNHV